MFVLRRLILLLLPVIWFAGLAMIKSDHRYLWLVVAVFFVYLLLAVWQTCKGQINKAFFHFLILPILFGAASFIFVLFLVSPLAFYGVSALSALVLYFLLKQYFIYFNLPFKYQPYSLESLTFYICLLLFYFLFSSSFAGLILLKLNIFFIVAAFCPMAGLVIYQFFWIHKLSIKQSWIFVLVLPLVLLELFVAVSYLPTNYYVNGFFLTIACYLMLGLSRASLNKTLNKNQLISYLVVASVLSLATFLSAQWN